MALLDVKITLIETPPKNRRIHGGQMASWIELGFEVKVWGLPPPLPGAFPLP